MRTIRATRTVKIPEGGTSQRSRFRAVWGGSNASAFLHRHSCLAAGPCELPKYASFAPARSVRYRLLIVCVLCAAFVCLFVVKVTVAKRKVQVKGPRGTLNKSFSHTSVDLALAAKGRELRAEMWWGDRKGLACVRTVCSHIENMIVGVTKGFQYKMRFVYAHFPISVTTENDNKEIAIRNFLGEKEVRFVPLLPGVSFDRSKDVKDEIVLSGIDINAVSQNAANIQQATRVCDKDIRKFLDGIYVSSKGNIVADE